MSDKKESEQVDIKQARGNQGEVYRDAAAIRQAVFVTEQGIDPKLEFDGEDAQMTHYVGYVAGKPVVTARLNDQVAPAHIQRVATLKADRHHGYAFALLQALLNQLPGQTVELNAQETAVDFYKRLGFKQVGDAFLEVGIVHYRMVKN